MNTKRYLALVMALVMVFSLVVPASAVETLAQNGDETAKLTVSARVQGNDNPQDAAVGTIFSNMNAQLVLYYGNYLAQNTVNIVGQTKTHANQTTLSLGGTAGDGISFTNCNTYFPGLDRLDSSGDGYAIRFVDNLGTTSQSWDYNLSKATDADIGVTLNLTVIRTGTEALDEAQDNADTRWQALKAEAFTNTDQTSDDSYISLAAGSYLQMANEKLTVNDGGLLLDDFSNATQVNANIDRAYASLTYTPTTTTAYQLLLKQGTQFSLGHSIAEVKQDLLVTMSNVTKKYTESILGEVRSSLTTNTEEALAENLLEVFSEIAGLVQSTDPKNPVVITFGRPATEVAISDPVVVDNTTTSTAIAVDTTGTTATYNIKTTTTTTTTTESGDESTTTTTTKPVTVETDTAATVVDAVKTNTTNEAVSAKDAVTAYEQNNSATFMAALESGGTVTAENVLKTTAAAKAIATAAAQGGVTVSEITKAEVILQTVLKDVDTTNATPTVTYDIKPVAQLYDGNGEKLGNPVELDNDDIKDGQTFTFDIPVPAFMNTSHIKVTHTGDNSNDVEVGIYSPTGNVGYVRYVEVTVSHFSDFELEPISDLAENISCFRTLALDEDISINFYVKAAPIQMNESEYTLEYFTTVNSAEGGHQTVNLGQLEKRKLSDNNYYYYVKLADFAAKQMTDTVTVKILHNNTQIGDDKVYSIQDYCSTAISGYSGDNTYADLIALCKAVLDYGTYSQYYFDYNLGNLANSEAPYYSLDVIPDSYAPSSTAGEILKTLSLESHVEMSFYVPAGTNVEVTADGLNVAEPVETTLSNNAKYMRYTITGFAARNLNQEVTVNSYTWSPLMYAYQAQSSGKQSLVDVVRALYHYYFYADKYFNS